MYVFVHACTFVCMCVCAFVFEYFCICVNVCAFVCIYMKVCASVFICVNVCTRVYMCACIWVLIFNSSFPFVHLRTYTHVLTSIHEYTYTHTHILDIPIHMYPLCLPASECVQMQGFVSHCGPRLGLRAEGRGGESGVVSRCPWRGGFWEPYRRGRRGRQMACVDDEAVVWKVVRDKEQ